MEVTDDIPMVRRAVCPSPRGGQSDFSSLFGGRDHVGRTPGSKWQIANTSGGANVFYDMTQIFPGWRGRPAEIFLYPPGGGGYRFPHLLTPVVGTCFSRSLEIYFRGEALTRDYPLNGG